MRMSQSVRTPYVACATVVKTQGLNGEVVVVQTGDLPLVSLEGCSVWFLPPMLHDVNEAVVESVEDSQRGALVCFEGVDSIDMAEKLVGRTILALRSEVGAQTRAESLMGRRVRCVEHGDLGTITAVIQTPANDVWQVDGPLGCVLIPVIDQVVLSNPLPQEGPIEVHLLPGLIDSEAEELLPGKGEGDEE